MKILNGTKKADQILEKIRKKIDQKNIEPTLAVFLIGEDDPSEIYVKNKKDKGEEVGINVKVFRFPPLVNQKVIIEKIKELNKASEVDGIIVQLPLPDEFDPGKIISTIDPKKDVDGFHKENLKLLEDKNKEPYLYPVLPQAIYSTLEECGKDLKKVQITALVNSDIFGNTLKLYLKRKGIKVQYLKEQKNEILKNSDVIISAKGEANLINNKNIKDGAALIDAGFNQVQNRTKGDVDREDIEKKASFLTPVPGGIGPLTVAFLLKNTYLANINL